MEKIPKERIEIKSYYYYPIHPAHSTVARLSQPVQGGSQGPDCLRNSRLEGGLVHLGAHRSRGRG